MCHDQYDDDSVYHIVTCGQISCAGTGGRARICRALWRVDAVSCGLCSMRLYQCDSESYGMDCRYIGRAVCFTVSAACDAYRGLFLHDFATLFVAKLLRMVDLPAISWNHIVWCVQVDGRTRTDV